MRLGLIGPCDGDAAQLARFALHVTEQLRAERVVYLGVDGALDDFVAVTAERIVGGDPNEAAIWERAARLCRQGAPAEIDAFLQAQRKRQTLRLFQSLESADAHAVELLGGKLTLLTHDKSNLDAEDMMPAAFLVYGRSTAPLTKRIGARWFLTPGRAPSGGLMVLDDEQDPVVADWYGAALSHCGSTALDVGETTQVKVQH